MSSGGRQYEYWQVWRGVQCSVRVRLIKFGKCGGIEGQSEWKGGMGNYEVVIGSLRGRSVVKIVERLKDSVRGRLDTIGKCGDGN